MKQVHHKYRMLMMVAVALAAFAANSNSAQALDLDWSGNFRVESHWVRNYGQGNNDATRLNAGGYFAPGGGSKDAQFETLFLRLKPKVVVNDNVYIKSELWFGNPIFGFFGDSAPYTVDQREYYSNQSRGSVVSAQRFWGEFLSDIGTFQVGRAPLNWGLGIVWNAGDNVWDRYESTGDVIRLVSKFGAFSFVPSIIKYSTGNTVGGACGLSNPATGICNPGTGGGSVMEYSLALKYENPDEEFEGGVNFIKRIAGAAQDPNGGGYNGVLGSTTGNTSAPGTTGLAPAAAGSNYNMFDLYGRKHVGKFTFAGEVPIVSGDVGGVSYKTYAIALEGGWRLSDTWETTLHAGHAPGQPSSTNNPDKYRAFFFNPNYTIGLIMFHYQLANLGGVNTQNNAGVPANRLQSPFDNPIVNANYLAWTWLLHAEKWTFHTSYLYAKANESADPGSVFFNTWQRRFVRDTTNQKQSKSLGSEVDFGTSFKWDENFTFGFDFGWFFPGDFYRYSNAVQENATASVFATQLRAGVTF